MIRRLNNVHNPLHNIVTELDRNDLMTLLEIIAVTSLN